MRGSDRGLLIVAKANISVAKRDIREQDEVYVNFALFNITQAVEKTIKYLCSCNGIDYDYGHYVYPLIDKLLQKNVKVPQLVQDSAEDYGKWATKSRYTASQLVQRSYIDRHIECVSAWIDDVERQLLTIM